MTIYKMALLENLLTKRDAICLLELINASLSCTNADELRELIHRLKNLVPFDFSTCLLGQTGTGNSIEPYEVININYPPQWVELYLSKKYHERDPIIKENFARFRLQYWTDTFKLYKPPSDFLSEAENFGLRKGYSHGMKNIKGTEGSLFSFSGKSIEHNTHTEGILNLIVPHLHQALVRIVRHRKTEHIPISQRERGVLEWLKRGKTSWEISVILGISERTVKFHVKNIMQKLDVVNRTQAVAIALELGIIALE